jgi:hypothetical protein
MEAESSRVKSQMIPQGDIYPLTSLKNKSCSFFAYFQIFFMEIFFYLW